MSPPTSLSLTVTRQHHVISLFHFDFNKTSNDKEISAVWPLNSMIILLIGRNYIIKYAFITRKQTVHNLRTHISIYSYI